VKKEIENEYNVKVVAVCTTMKEALSLGTKKVITAAWPEVLFYAVN
jgi:hypothetical protein